MKPVLFHSEAKVDLNEAAAHYDRQRGGLGRELRNEVEAAVRRIQMNPKIFSLYDKQGTRKCLVWRFPYAIFFHEFDEILWVYAVAHHKRRPGYWKRRRR